MGAAEDRIQLLVVGGLDVDFEQLLLHAVEVFAGFLEEDLVELGQVQAGVGARASRCFAHVDSNVGLEGSLRRGG